MRPAHSRKTQGYLEVNLTISGLTQISHQRDARDTSKCILKATSGARARGMHPTRLADALVLECWTNFVGACRGRVSFDYDSNIVCAA